MSELYKPLQDDVLRRIPRLLRGLTAELGRVIDEKEFGRIFLTPKKELWAAILSPAGSGKTSFLHWLNTLAQLPQTRFAATTPISLELYAHEQTPQLLRAIYNEVAKLSDAPPPMDDPIGDFSRVISAIAAQHKDGIVILLDNYDRLPPAIALSLGNSLRNLHHLHKKRVKLVITSSELMETIQHETSPLENILEPYELLDFSDEAFLEKIQPWMYENHQVNFAEDGSNAFWQQCGGFPYIVWAALEALRHTTRVTQDRVQSAVEQNAEITGWLTKTKRRLEKDDKAYFALRAFATTEEITWDSTAQNAILLRLLGLVRLDEANRLVWRNGIVEKAFKDWERPLQSVPELVATGEVNVSLILNLRHFVIPPDKEMFDHLRGSNEYEAALQAFNRTIDERTASPEEANRPLAATHFEHDYAEDQLRQLSADLSIFRHESASAAFSPIYKLNNPTFVETRYFQPPAGLKRRVGAQNYDAFVDLLREEWKLWGHKSVQLTRDGFAHIRLKRTFTESPLPIVAQYVMGLEKRSEATRNGYRYQLDRSVQWEMAMACIELFLRKNLTEIDAVPQSADENDHEPVVTKNYTLTIQTNGNSERLHFAFGQKPDRAYNESAYPLNDRYVTYLFHKLCDCHGQTLHPYATENPHIVSSSILKQNAQYRGQLHSLLEGILVKTDGIQGEAIWDFPQVSDEASQQTLAGDLSSWENELCLFSQDNGVVYFSQSFPVNSADSPNSPRCGKCDFCLVPRVQGLWTVQRPNVRYEDYWRCILRGIDYIMNLRLLARLLATKSTDDLVHIAGFKPQLEVARGYLINDKEYERLRHHVNTNTRLLAHLRDVTTPLFISRADYATVKFRHFIEVSQIAETIKNAEKDIDDINSYLQHYETQIQTHKLEEERKEAGETNTLLTIVALILTISSLLLTLPSFAKDFEESEFGKWARGKTEWWNPLRPSYWTEFDIVEMINVVVTLSVFALTIYVSRQLIQRLRRRSKKSD